MHNLGHEYWSLIDPPLTETGRDQCLKLNAEFPYHSKVELVVSSPLCRAMYTATESFRSVFDSKPGLNLVVLPGLQEISDFPCDVGSEPAILKEKMNDIGVNIDWTFLHEGWTNKVSMNDQLVLFPSREIHPGPLFIFIFDFFTVVNRIF